MNLKERLDKLADAIADHATKLLGGKKEQKKEENSINLQESVDAFKALSQYYAIQLKTPKKKAASDDDELDFTDFSDAVKDDVKVSGSRTNN